MGDEHQVPIVAKPPLNFHFKYTVQKGYFQQSEDSTDDKTFDFKKENFGLIPRPYTTDPYTTTQQTPWTRFHHFVRYMQSTTTTTNPNERYKVLFLGRHGQGWHNVAESKYGTKAWDCYWSTKEGANNITWADANLTPTGEAQAKDVRAVWAQNIAKGIPLPEIYYVSPLTRAIHTADLSFAGLEVPAGYRPCVKELLREALGVHTCDRRSSKTRIAERFPHVRFEDGFAEEDGLWESEYREPASARRYRLARFLDDVFESDGHVFVSMTSRSGAIRSMLEVLGHRQFALETGGVIPVFVKAERVEGERVKPPKEPSDAPPICKEPPTDL